MDEDIFRNYFIKLYKSLGIMEGEFLKVLSNKEKKGFLLFTQSMKDLALHFKCFKEHKISNKDDEYAIRPSKKKIEKVASKMIFGVGEQVQSQRSDSCKLVPSSLESFFKVRKIRPSTTKK